MRRFVVPLVLVVAVAFPGGAAAAWRLLASGSGSAKAKTLGSGNLPTASVSGRKVTLAWTASTYTSGGTVAAYVVKRYQAVTGVAQTVGAACSGTISALTCTENNVPTGSWRYTVTPAAGNWRGTESPKTGAVTVV
jgi:hypothetical protein